MVTLRRKASVLFLSSFMFLTPIDNSISFQKEYDDIGKATEANLLESLSTIPLSRSKVNYSGNKVIFNIGSKQVNLINDNKLAVVNDNDKITEYYFSEDFKVDDGYITFSKSQYNLLVNNIECKDARRIRYGRAIDRVDHKDFINIYSDADLNNYLTKVDVGSDVRIINTVLDGKFKVLTPDGKEGFVDTRFLRISDDNLPPALNDFIVDTDYVITISQDNQKMRVYKKDVDNYDIVKEFSVSTGMSSEHTPNGLFTVKQNRGPWFFSQKYNSGAKYFVEFRGNYLFHSIPFHEDQTVDYIEANKLGSKVSTGCIRLPVDDAKWIYDNMPADTLVIIDNKDIDLNSVIKNKNI